MIYFRQIKAIILSENASQNNAEEENEKKKKKIKDFHIKLFRLLNFPKFGLKQKITSSLHLLNKIKF
jgi:hypothetical protein